MKLRKFMMCLLAAVTISGLSGIHTYAAEVTEQEAVVTTTATEENAELTIESDTDLTQDVQELETEDVAEDITDADIESDVTQDVEVDEAKDETSDEADTKKTTKKTVTKKSVDSEKNEVSYTKAELRLLSALIYCEANGEPYVGKLAVGIVVVNRKESKLFPDSIKSVIYQKYQFGPARNGTLKKALQEYDNGNFTSDNEKACIKAAKAALSGVKKVNYKDKTINMKSYLYFSGRVSNAKLTIANHQFK
ncbi:MAG: N-acetylmuramoyl-L-alanine amidase [Clostridiales bacterium]|nr:N-acetylmuramoyl-L-alanine amidase [Clostridiales bacterium]